jgi:hypothetical protein
LFACSSENTRRLQVANRQDSAPLDIGYFSSDDRSMTRNVRISNKLPPDVPGRLRLAGKYLYGTGWRRRMAMGLQISRSTLFEWLRGNIKTDREIVELLDRERDAASERGVELTALRRRFMALGRRA